MSMEIALFLNVVQDAEGGGAAPSGTPLVTEDDIALVGEDGTPLIIE